MPLTAAALPDMTIGLHITAGSTRWRNLHFLNALLHRRMPDLHRNLLPIQFLPSAQDKLDSDRMHIKDRFERVRGAGVVQTRALYNLLCGEMFNKSIGMSRRA